MEIEKSSHDLINELKALDLSKDAGTEESQRTKHVESILIERGILDSDGRFTEFGRKMI